MKNLIVVGASGFGREVLSWALDCERSQSDWRVKGFLDDNPRALNNFGCSYNILGTIQDYHPGKNDLFICAIGDPKTKIDICESIVNRGGKFINLIHPSAIIGSDNNIGNGCVLCPRSIITCNTRIGDFVTINCNSSIGHDVTIGKGTTLSSHCDVTGFATLGEGVFLGSNSVILPSVRVGNYAKIGVGSTVIRTVKPNSTVLGSPAKQIAGFK